MKARPDSYMPLSIRTGDIPQDDAAAMAQRIPSPRYRPCSRSAHATEERTRRLHERETEAKEIKEELVELCFDAPSTQCELSDHILNIGTYLSNAGWEIRQARAIEVNLDNYARIDRLVDQCTKRAKEAWQRIRVQSVLVAQRLDDEWHEMIYEMQCAPVV